MEKDLTKIEDYLKNHPMEALAIAEDINNWNGRFEWARAYIKYDLDGLFDSVRSFMDAVDPDIDLGADLFRDTDYGIMSTTEEEIAEDAKDYADDIAEELINELPQVYSEHISKELNKLINEVAGEENIYDRNVRDDKREILFKTDRGNAWARVELELRNWNSYDEFAASGEFNGGCGQCLDEINQYMDANHKFEGGITWGEIYYWWKNYHLKSVGDDLLEEMKKVIINK